MNGWKNCTKCDQSKPLSDFYKSKPSPDGHRTDCKACKNAATKEWTRNNQVAHAATRRAWGAKNADKVTTWNDRQYARNPDAFKANALKWKKLNPARRKADKVLREKRVRRAVPKWINRFFVSEIYDLARRRTKSTGVPHSVDHIVPLQSKLVCGLHWEGNLRVIPLAENLTKHNQYWPDMPDVAHA